MTLGIAGSALAADGGIHFIRGTVDPSTLPQPRAAQRLNSGIFLLQFQRLPDEAARAHLRQRGVALLAYVPDRAYWARVGDGIFVADIEGLAGPLTAAWQPSSEFRLSPLLTSPLPDHARLDDGRIEVQVLFFEDEAPARIARMLQDAGLELVDWQAPQLARIRMQPDQLQQLAGLDAVHWVEPKPAPNQAFNQTAAQRIRANVLAAPPYSLSGLASSPASGTAARSRRTAIFPDA